VYCTCHRAGGGVFWPCDVGTFTTNIKKKMAMKLQLITRGTYSRLIIEKARFPPNFRNLHHFLQRYQPGDFLSNQANTQGFS
jgi:hypothetical protein